MRIFLKRLTSLSAVIALLSACASQIMENYVGKSITEPMLDYGRPESVFDLPDGRRAFQWVMRSSGVLPMSTPSESTIYGTGGWASVTTTSTTYLPYSQTCAYTLIAKPVGNDWIVDGFRKPRLGCELT